MVIPNLADSKRDIMNKIIILVSINLFFVTLANSQESTYYKISDVNIPEDLVLEVGGLAFDEDGSLMACTRRGEVWNIKDPASSNPEFNRYFAGLHEPLGLAYKDGSYYMAQRGELTKLTDTDGDGKADEYETIYNWPLAANYHEYAYGPVILPDGNMLVNLNLQWIGRGASLSKWAGWMLMISPEGEMTPIATGLRSPAGLGLNKNGDIFYTENQGDWVGTGRMTHIEKGDFAGHVEGLKWSGERGSPIDLTMEGVMADVTNSGGTTLYDYAQETKGVKAPSVWFPHTILGISTSDIEIIPEDFGPFAGQLLVGDQGHSKLMRVYQEKVNGSYQGVAFNFVEGFSSGLLRTEWGPNNTLYVGMTNRGWASTGKKKFGIQRLNWTGKMPFEMKTISAKPDGFEIEFTQPTSKRTAANPDNYSITDFSYKYHHIYGSDPINQEERTIFKVDLSQDGLTARLYVEGMREGYVYEIKGEGVRSSTGGSLLHNVGYYTLNNIPDGEKMDGADHAVHAATIMKSVDLQSDKRITTMPGNWLNGPEEEIKIGTKAGMLFDKRSVTVKAGSKVKLVLNNPDDMMHNLLIVKPGTVNIVANMANKLGLKGQAMGYVPDSDNVIAHTNLLEPGSSDVIYFVAPEEPGDYTFVCTFPAHAATMKGVFKVE